MTRGAEQGTVGAVCTILDFLHQVLFIGSQRKYAWKRQNPQNTFENVYSGVRIFLIREVEDLFVGDAFLLPFFTLKNRSSAFR